LRYLDFKELNEVLNEFMSIIDDLLTNLLECTQINNDMNTSESNTEEKPEKYSKLVEANRSF